MPRPDVLTLMERTETAFKAGKFSRLAGPTDRVWHVGVRPPWWDAVSHRDRVPRWQDAIMRPPPEPRSHYSRPRQQRPVIRPPLPLPRPRIFRPRIEVDTEQHRLYTAIYLWELRPGQAHLPEVPGRSLAFGVYVDASRYGWRTALNYINEKIDQALEHYVCTGKTLVQP